MNRAALLVIFAWPLGLAVACGEPAANNPVGTGGIAPSTGGASGTSAAGSSMGGTAVGAGNGSGGALGGTGNAAGVGPGGSGLGGTTAGASGVPSTGGDAGSAGAAGTAGAGASGGASGTGGAGATGGDGGTGPVVPCTFAVTHTRSTAIPTVEIVTFTTTLAGVTSAYIDFGLVGNATTMRAPVDLAEMNYRTLLLGMKAARDYVFRITANSATGSCTSPDTMLTTGALASTVPTITRTVMNAAAQDRGFIITSGGVGSAAPAYIIDADGDVVWWSAAPRGTCRALMSYDGKSMWMMALNYPEPSSRAAGEAYRASMDGMTRDIAPAGFARAHHDFTVLPDGGLAIIGYTGSNGNNSTIFERSATGTITPVVADMASVYALSSQGAHPNSIHYHASDQTYTISDRFVNLYVKVRRNGQLLWQFGGSNPVGASFTGLPSWQVNHGHDFLADGTLLFFNNAMAAPSVMREFKLNETAHTATTGMNYQSGTLWSQTLGDVQRLPNGNTLVTFSTPRQGQMSEIHEISPTGAIVQRLSASSFGYTEFRKSLYGPPLR